MRSFLILLIVFVWSSFVFSPALAADKAGEEADIQAIKRIYEKWDEAENAGDANALVLLVTDDIIWMEPNRPVIVGKAALHELLESSYETHSMKNMKTVVDEIRLSGDWAYVRSSYCTIRVPKDGSETVNRIGRIVDLCERQEDGSWKIARDIFNFVN